MDLPDPEPPHSSVAAGENRTRATNGLVYDVVAVDVDPTPDQILRARAGMPAGAADTAELPADLPARVRVFVDFLAERLR